MTAAAKTNVCLVGVGLIGGSLGMALRKTHHRSYNVMGWGRTARKLQTAIRMGAIDEAETNPKKAVENADIVVLCVPVHLIAPQLKSISSWLKKGAIVTDVGSVKKSVILEARQALKGRPDLTFVGAHPIAGSEKTGVENATATLFKDATCVITSDGTNKTYKTNRPYKSHQIITQLWKNAGAQCVTLSSSDHDRFLALTSHLPHLLAFSLFQAVSDAAQKNPVIKSLVAGSFRDMTRIAGADPELWAGILQTNRNEIQKAVRVASKHLMHLGRAPLAKLIPTLRRLQKAKTSWPTKK